MSGAGSEELVLVVDVSEFSEGGFVTKTSFEGKKIEVEFDPNDKGVYLTKDLGARLRLKRGAALSLKVETDPGIIAASVFSGIAKKSRVSSQMVYYEIGREGGAVVRIRKK